LKTSCTSPAGAVRRDWSSVADPTDPMTALADSGPTRRAQLAALLRRDRVVFSPRYRGGVTLVFVLGALQTIRSDEAFLWLGVALAGALAVMVPVLEWRVDAERLIGSLPVSRVMVVLERYLATGLACLGAWLVWAGAGAILSPVLDPGRIDPAIAVTLPGSLTLFVLASLLLAAFLPIRFRFGLGRAAVAFAPVALALVAAARRVAIGAVPAGALEGAGPVLPGDAVRAALVGLIDRVGATVAVALVGIGVLALFAVSCSLAAGWHRTRGL
jgi:hypothetical protein